MSYILDALRKADAQRERDPARGIHAQPLPPAPSAAARPQWPIWLTTAGVVVCAGVLLLVEWREPASTASTAPTAPAVAQVPVAPVPVAPQVAEAIEPAAPPMPAAAPPPPAAVAAPVPAAPAAPAAPAPRAVVAPAPAAPPPAAPPAPAAAATDRVLALAELPPDVQRDLPKLAITGGVHSDNAAQRMLIVGGQVMGEGSEVAPGVVLELIRPKSAVLRFRGLRFSVGY